MAVMKVAFVGTHGTGKTTLCYELAAWMKKREARVDMVREVARRCPLPINQDTTLEAQSWILHRQIAEEIQTASEQDVVICDRSVLDNYAYLTHRLGPQPPLDELVRYWMRTYSHLFKVPIVAAPAFDGTRDTSAAFQKAIDDQIDSLIQRFGINVHRLAPEDRGATPGGRDIVATGRGGWLDVVARAIGMPPKPPQIGLFSEDADSDNADSNNADSDNADSDNVDSDNVDSDNADSDDADSRDGVGSE